MFQQIIHLGLVVLASLLGKQDYVKIIYSDTIYYRAATRLLDCGPNQKTTL